MAEAEWVDSQKGLEDVTRALASADAFALDTEFHREKTYFPHVALVQIAWDGGLVLIDPLELDLAPLAPVINGPAVTVAHAAEQDLEVLDRSVGATPRELFDTQLAAGFLGYSTPSLTNLASELLDVRLPKGDRLTDWTRRPLTANQQRYAASDVAHLLEMRDVVEKRLTALNRLQWAREECARMVSRRTPPDPTVAWWRMKDARGMKGKTRGVAQAVAEWREREAMRRDLPARFILSDMAMASLVHRAPTSRAELEEIRGLDARGLRPQVVEGILSAVTRGAAMAPGEVRLPPSDDLARDLRPAVTLVASWIAQLARTVKIDAPLLATRADIASFLAGDPDARLANGWRAHLVGEPIRKLVAGEAALAFAGNGQLVLEERSHRAVEVEVPTTEG